MSVLEVLGLLAAGIGGGLTGSIAGLASLVTYPALLVVGLGPIAANATNTVALVFSGIGSTAGSRFELAGQGRRLRRLLPVALLGGLLGAVALLWTPPGIFARIVPWLVAAAALAMIPWRRTVAADDVVVGVTIDRPLLPPAVAAISFYGGYFGAAAGVALLATLLATTGERLARANAAKNVLLGGANLTGAVVFMLFGPVRWTAMVPLGAGCLVGSRMGPVVVRHVPARPLRLIIAALGLGLAVALGAQAYF